MSESARQTLAVLAIEPPTGGGVYQYTRSIISAAKSSEFELSVFYIDRSWAESDLYDPDSWTRVSIVGRAVRRGLRTVIRRLPVGFGILGPFQKWLAPKLRRLDPDLVVYPTPNAMAFETDYPYLMAIHDVQYLLNPQFPEVGAEEVRQRRSYVYTNGSEMASGILVDSEAGKEDVLRFFDVEPSRVFELPFVPPDYLDKYDEIDEQFRATLPERYVFYPAQFWEHKNHVTLLEALAQLRDKRGIDVSCVLVGSRKNAYETVQETIARHGLEDQVHELGFVEDEKMYTLYDQATALVMPTFLGPTNIPPIEAFKMECPVITSDVHGLPEQVGDAGLLADPESPSEFADAIEAVWTDESVRNRLIEAGKRKLELYSQPEFNERFRQYAEEAIERGEPV